MRVAVTLVLLLQLVNGRDDLLFEVWKRKHEKVYSSTEEEARRMSIFMENHAFITSHARGSSYTLGHNIFSDVPWSEFRARFLRNISSSSRNDEIVPDPPGLFMMRGGMDWQSRGAVTPVRTQGQCGSCWAFSAAEAIEGNVVAEGGDPITLSPEFLVDCDATNHGCQGGTMERAFDFVVRRGICTESNDPYVGGGSRCGCTSSVFINGYTKVAQSVDALTRALVKTPVAVSIEADSRVFQFYSGGIIDSSACGEALDHGVLLVGFGFGEDATPYWRVKNSWGESWGEDGYVRIQRGDENVCGVLSDASFPTGAKVVESPLETIATANALIASDDDELRSVLGRLYEWVVRQVS